MSAPRSRRALLATASLAAFAGCLDDGLLDSTADPAASSSQPPGVSDDALDDPEALFSAHEDRLRSDGFALDLHLRESSSDDGESFTDYDVTVESGPDGAPLWLSGTLERGDVSEPVEVWETESQSITKRGRGDDQRYLASERSGDSLSEFARPGFLFGSVEPGSFTVETVDEREGSTLTTLVADDLGATTDSDDLEGATLVVDERGVIHQASATFSAPGGSIDYEIVDIGSVEPTEPAWLADVPEAAFASVDVTVDPMWDGEALALESRGDDPVPAGTTVTVHDGDATYRGALETELASDETVYVAVQGRSLAVSGDRPSAVDAHFGSSLSVSVVSPEGVTFEEVSIGWASDSASADGDAASESGTGDGGRTDRIVSPEMVYHGNWSNAAATKITT